MVSEAQKRASRKYYAKNKERLRAEARIESNKYYHSNKERVRDSFIQRTFKISLKEYEDLLSKQEGVCAICKQPESTVTKNGGTYRSLAIDHCHITGKVRGLLCVSCNTGLGKFKDSLERLNLAVKYLEKYG